MTSKYLARAAGWTEVPFGERENIRGESNIQEENNDFVSHTVSFAYIFSKKKKKAPENKTQ